MRDVLVVSSAVLCAIARGPGMSDDTAAGLLYTVHEKRETYLLDKD
jgi:hypothetical protein